MNVSRVRPGGQLSHGSKLLEETAHNPFAVCVGAQAIQLGHHERERPLQFADGVFRIELALLIETALALLELFAIEVGVIGKRKIREFLVARRARVGQEARHPVP